ncbi:MAG TPA: hypothetical protein VGP70_10435 [Actinomadura sp.]|jgi:hypothetical protein|nr:hypothetical protein [Actinomadura sp.]
MAEHPHDDQAGDRSTEPEDRTRAQSPASGPASPPGAQSPSSRPGRARFAARAGALRKRVVSVIATGVSILTMLVVAVLAVHILFAVFEANGSNAIVVAVREWADRLAWEFKDVFAPRDPKVSVLVNYGLAAVVYLIVGRIIVGLVRRAA